jgi:hypothetical protein
MDNDVDSLDEVIFDGIRFLESITRHYGAEHGMVVWEQLGEVLGPEIKGKVFFSILTGESSNRVRIRVGTCNEAVTAIKAIRTATGYGLKEAKDAYDLSKIKVVTLDNVQRDSKKQLVKTLRDIGMIVL